MFFLFFKRDQHKTNKLVTFSLSQKNLEIILGGGSNLLVTTGTFIMWFLFPFYVTDIVRESGLMIGFLLGLLSFYLYNLADNENASLKFKIFKEK